MKIVDVGIDPKILKYNFLTNARTKTRFSIVTQTSIISDDKNMVMDEPIISLTIDNLITNVNPDGTCEKAFSYYNPKVEEASWLPKEHLNKIKDELNKMSSISGVTKIKPDGSILETNYNNVENVPKAYLETNDVIKSILFPAEPVGIGAVWINKEINQNSNLAVDFDVLHTFHLTQRSGSVVTLEIMSKFNSSKEQLKNGSDELNEYKRVFGYTISQCDIDLETGGSEYEISSVFDNTVQLLDLNTEARTIVKTQLKSKYTV